MKIFDFLQWVSAPFGRTHVTQNEYEAKRMFILVKVPFGRTHVTQNEYVAKRNVHFGLKCAFNTERKPNLHTRYILAHKRICGIQA